MDTDRIEAFEAAKRRSFAQLLIRCGRLVHERGLALARERLDLPELRAAHLDLMPHIPFAGIRQTELAASLGVSKQAVGQLVTDLVARDVLVLAPDPVDRRAKLVRFTDRGLELMHRGLGVLGEIEGELRASLGDTGATELHRLLLLTNDALAAD